jgi:hypothetical protein
LAGAHAAFQPKRPFGQVACGQFVASDGDGRVGAADGGALRQWFGFIELAARRDSF